MDQGGDLCGVQEVRGVGGASKLGRERLKNILGAGDEGDGGPRPGEGTGEGLTNAP